MDVDKELFIAIDLELEQPNDGVRIVDSYVQEPFIIQAGWVVFRRDPFEVVSKYQRCVPLGLPLSTYIKNLTHIKDSDLDAGASLESIYADLAADMRNYGTSRVVRQWGGGDMPTLKEELGSDVQWEFGGSGYNVKHLYQDVADLKGISRSGGLSKCVSRMGLEWHGRGKHQALVDALNTARLYSKLYETIKKGNYNGQI